MSLRSVPDKQAGASGVHSNPLDQANLIGCTLKRKADGAEGKADILYCAGHGMEAFYGIVWVKNGKKQRLEMSSTELMRIAEVVGRHPAVQNVSWRNPGSLASLIPWPEDAKRGGRVPSQNQQKRTAQRTRSGSVAVSSPLAASSGRPPLPVRLPAAAGDRAPAAAGTAAASSLTTGPKGSAAAQSANAANELAPSGPRVTEPRLVAISATAARSAASGATGTAASAADEGPAEKAPARGTGEAGPSGARPPPAAREAGTSGSADRADHPGKEGGQSGAGNDVPKAAARRRPREAGASSGEYGGDLPAKRRKTAAPSGESNQNGAAEGLAAAPCGPARASAVQSGVSGGAGTQLQIGGSAADGEKQAASRDEAARSAAADRPPPPVQQAPRPVSTKLSLAWKRAAVESGAAPAAVAAAATTATAAAAAAAAEQPTVPLGSLACVEVPVGNEREESAARYGTGGERQHQQQGHVQSAGRQPASREGPGAAGTSNRDDSAPGHATGGGGGGPAVAAHLDGSSNDADGWDSGVGGFDCGDEGEAAYSAGHPEVYGVEGPVAAWPQAAATATVDPPEMAKAATEREAAVEPEGAAEMAKAATEREAAVEPEGAAEAAMKPASEAKAAAELEDEAEAATEREAVVEPEGAAEAGGSARGRPGVHGANKDRANTTGLRAATAGAPPVTVRPGAAAPRRATTTRANGTEGAATTAAAGRCGAEGTGDGRGSSTGAEERRAEEAQDASQAHCHSEARHQPTCGPPLHGSAQGPVPQRDEPNRREPGRVDREEAAAQAGLLGCGGAVGQHAVAEACSRPAYVISPATGRQLPGFLCYRPGDRPLSEQLSDPLRAVAANRERRVEAVLDEHWSSSRNTAVFLVKWAGYELDPGVPDIRGGHWIRETTLRDMAPEKLQQWRDGSTGSGGGGHRGGGQGSGAGALTRDPSQPSQPAAFGRPLCAVQCGQPANAAGEPLPGTVQCQSTERPGLLETQPAGNCSFRPGLVQGSASGAPAPAPSQTGPGPSAGPRTNPSVHPGPEGRPAHQRTFVVAVAVTAGLVPGPLAKGDRRPQGFRVSAAAEAAAAPPPPAPGRPPGTALNGFPMAGPMPHATAAGVSTVAFTAVLGVGGSAPAVLPRADLTATVPMPEPSAAARAPPPAVAGARRCLDAEALVDGRPEELRAPSAPACSGRPGLVPGGDSVLHTAGEPMVASAEASPCKTSRGTQTCPERPSTQEGAAEAGACRPREAGWGEVRSDVCEQHGPGFGQGPGGSRSAHTATGGASSVGVSCATQDLSAAAAALGHNGGVSSAPQVTTGWAVRSSMAAAPAVEVPPATAAAPAPAPVSVAAPDPGALPGSGAGGLDDVFSYDIGGGGGDGFDLISELGSLGTLADSLPSLLAAGTSAQVGGAGEDGRQAPRFEDGLSPFPSLQTSVQTHPQQRGQARLGVPTGAAGPSGSVAVPGSQGEQRAPIRAPPPPLQSPQRKPPPPQQQQQPPGLFFQANPSLRRSSRQRRPKRPGGCKAAECTDGEEVDAFENEPHGPAAEVCAEAAAGDGAASGDARQERLQRGMPGVQKQGRKRPAAAAAEGGDRQSEVAYGGGGSRPCQASSGSQRAGSQRRQQQQRRRRKPPFDSELEKDLRSEVAAGHFVLCPTSGRRYPKSLCCCRGDLLVCDEGEPEPDQVFEVERIMDEITNDEGRFFLVKWKGYELDPGSLTSKGHWEPEDALDRGLPVRRDWEIQDKPFWFNEGIVPPQGAVVLDQAPAAPVPAGGCGRGRSGAD